RQSPRFSMSACLDSSTNTSRGFVLVASLPICETNRLRHVEMAAALVHLFTCLVRGHRSPLRHDVDVGRDFQERVKHKRAGLGDRFFHRQDPNEMSANAQVIALGFDIGVDHLIVEKLGGLRFAGNTPVVVVQQAAEKRELSFLIQNLDLHEVCELASKGFHLLFEPPNIALDMSAQQRLHAVIRKLRSEFFYGARGVMEETSECRTKSGL